MKLFYKYFFIFVIILVNFVFVSKVSAQTCATCPSGWYPCSNSCCVGSGCPSNSNCGICPSGWVQYPTGGKEGSGPYAYCSDTGTTCGNLCMSCGGTGGGNPKGAEVGMVWLDLGASSASAPPFENWIDKVLQPVQKNCGAAYTQTLPGLRLFKRERGGGVTTETDTGWICVSGTPRSYTSLLIDFDLYINIENAGAPCSDISYLWSWLGDTGANSGSYTPMLNWTQFGKVVCSAPVHPGDDRDLYLYIKIKGSAPPPPAPRTFTGRLYETTNAGTCSNNGNMGLSGLSAKLYDPTLAQVGTTGTVSSADGSYAIGGLDASKLINYLAITGSLSNASVAYSLACVTSTGATCTKGAGTTANCIPTTSLSTGNVTANLGFTKISNAKWFTVLEGDLYSQSITSYVASAPAATSGFSPNLINTITKKGYGFVETTANTQTTGSGISESGGSAKQLTVASIGANSQDTWLNKFSFEAPASAVATIPAGNNFLTGKVYKTDAATFNTLLTAGSPAGTYTIVGAAPNTGAAIIYVTGGGTININSNFKNTGSTLETLLLVTDANVNIGANVAVTDATTTAIASPTQIDLSIITSGNITTQSKYNAGTNTIDNPVIINGILVAKGTVDLNRDLGPNNNSLYPAEYIKFYPYLMDLIKKYDLANTSNVSYTGLSTFDVQFNYVK